MYVCMHLVQNIEKKLFRCPFSQILYHGLYRKRMPSLTHYTTFHIIAGVAYFQVEILFLYKLYLVEVRLFVCLSDWLSVCPSVVSSAPICLLAGTSFEVKQKKKKKKEKERKKVVRFLIKCVLIFQRFAHIWFLY